MRKILSLCALLICASCSQTVSNDRSFVDPAFRDVRFSSFVVVGQSTNLAEQEAVEYSFVKELRENGIEALEHYTQTKSIQVELGKFESVF